MTMVDERFADDAFFIDQLVRPIANLYRISTLAPDGRSPGQPLAFVRQKRLAIREDIRFMADEDEREELFRLKARSVLEFRGRYDVVLPDGERAGVLQKVFGASLLRSTWRILDAGEQEVGQAFERSMPVAVLRRVIDLVPYGEFIPIVFHFTITADGREVGDLRRPIGVRDRYVLDLRSDSERRIDRRVAVALGVALDAL
ncbi:MAG: hypothetical protein M3188_02335, partial [Actinomycetota bacterium]|nr:hypothetical protein [Actinomycetota bacterium]